MEALMKKSHEINRILDKNPQAAASVATIKTATADLQALRALGAVSTKAAIVAPYGGGRAGLGAAKGNKRSSLRTMHFKKPLTA
jgi:hypothetical protein